MTHRACSSCSSSDGVVDYIDEGYSYCFACNTRFDTDNSEEEEFEPFTEGEQKTEEYTNQEPLWRLREEIISRSKSNTWHEAKSEWTFVQADFADRGDDNSCLCGHSPIVELCYLVNEHTKEEVVVGNVCVTKFLDIAVPVKKILPPLIKIKKDLSKSVNQEVLDLAYDRNIIDKNSYAFYSDTKGKRKLSDKQKKYKRDINQKILRGLLRKISSNSSTNNEKVGESPAPHQKLSDILSGDKLTKERDEWKKKAEEFLYQRNNYFNQLNKIKHFLNSNQLQDDENHGRKSNRATQNNT